jgi:hypothetical protein
MENSRRKLMFFEKFSDFDEHPTGGLKSIPGLYYNSARSVFQAVSGFQYLGDNIHIPCLTDATMASNNCLSIGTCFDVGDECRSILMCVALNRHSKIVRIIPSQNHHAKTTPLL